MAQSVISALSMYLDRAVRTPYMKSKFAILHNPEVFEYTPFGDQVMIREVVGGNAADYDSAIGFVEGGNGGSVTWNAFKAPYDRQFTVPVDALKEMGSITQNMTPSGVLLMERYFANFASEIDATACATIYGKALPENIYSDAGVTSPQLRTDADNIFPTLAQIRSKLFNKGIESEVAVFVSSTIFGNIEAALIKNMALANQDFVKFNVSTNGLEIEVAVIKYGNLYLVRVPDDRMNSHVTILNGKTGTGQDAGGWAPDTLNPDFLNVQLLAIPFEAGGVSIRHLVSNFTLPARFMGMSTAKLEKEIASLNELYGGQIELRNIGIDQTGDRFKYMNRIVYGTAVFETYRKTIIAVTK
jgi:hypothetical protein